VDLFDELDALSEGHPMGEVPDDVVGSWHGGVVTAKVRANLCRLADGREVAARVAATPYRQQQEVIDGWAARWDCSESLVRQRMGTARRVLAARDEAGPNATSPPSEVLNCTWANVVHAVREHYGLPSLKKEKTEAAAATEEELVAAWEAAADDLAEQDVAASAIVAAAKRVIAKQVARMEAETEAPEPDRVSVTAPPAPPAPPADTGRVGAPVEVRESGEGRRERGGGRRRRR